MQCLPSLLDAAWDEYPCSTVCARTFTHLFRALIIEADALKSARRCTDGATDGWRQGRMPPDVLKRREGSFGSYLTRRNEVLPQPPTYIEKLNLARSQQQRTAKSRKPLPPLSAEKAPSCTPPVAPASPAPHSDVDLREMVRAHDTTPPREGRKRLRAGVLS